jgi:hypothetical protein
VRISTLSGNKTATRSMLALAAVSALALSMIWMMSPVLGTHVTPTLIEGNASCGELGEYDHEFKIEPVASGSYDDPASDFSVDITVNDTADGQTVDFESNLGVDAVFVKGGDAGNLYVYDPAETSDDGLHAPANASGKWAGLSHISFCFNEAPTSQSPSPTPTPEESQPASASASVPASASPSGEGSQLGGTGTPEESQSNTALGQNGVNPLPTVLFSLILLGSLAGLAFANVKTARNRS